MSKDNDLNTYKGNGEVLSHWQKQLMQQDIIDFASALAVFDTRDNRELDEFELIDLMEEFKALEKVELIAKARRERIREMVFTHFAKQAFQKGEDPTLIGGEVDVLDRKFVKGGGGIAEPTMDEGKLRSLLGEDYLAVVDSTVIFKTNEDKLEAYLRRFPEMTSQVTEALIPGDKKPFRFSVGRVRNDYESE